MNNEVLTVSRHPLLTADKAILISNMDDDNLGNMCSTGRGLCRAWEACFMLEDLKLYERLLIHTYSSDIAMAVLSTTYILASVGWMTNRTFELFCERYVSPEIIRMVRLVSKIPTVGIFGIL